MRAAQFWRRGDGDGDAGVRRWRSLAAGRGEFCPVAHERRVSTMATRVARGLDPWTGAAPSPGRSCTSALRELARVPQELLDQALVLDRLEARSRWFARRHGVTPDRGLRRPARRRRGAA